MWKSKTTSPSMVGKFCSNKCVASYNSERLDTKTFSKCEICNKDFKTKPSHKSRRRTCSKKCSGELKKLEGIDIGSSTRGIKGINHHGWKGGRRIRKNGYVYIRTEDGSEMLEHRFVMEQHLKRKLSKDEHVHHIDENKENNSIENLTVMSRSEHMRFHAKDRIQKGTHHFLK